MASVLSRPMPQPLDPSADASAEARAEERSDAPGWEQVDLLSLAAPPPTPTPAAEPPPPVPVTLVRDREPQLASPDGPQRLLILDTETTGLDPEQHHCIEVGAVLFDVPHRAVLSQISFLLPCDRNEAEAVNGIAPAVTQLPQPWQSSLACFGAMLASADLVVAHNAPFDRQWFGRGALPAIDKPWLCSMDDLRWPPERQLRSRPSVRDLALAYGVPVWAAHRALTDCIYLAQVFERCPELETLLHQGLEPRRLYRARLTYEERHRAREAGFRWNEPVSGAWSRRLSEREAAALGFPVVPVDEGQELRSA